jgi:hypothetical protein
MKVWKREKERLPIAEIELPKDLLWGSGLYLALTE